ncbi:MAG: patatin-like phospholipase family protein [Chloroflexi bacterium]|nr:patatin-like phospholipase family protein [Chloroflexota bacterium]
MTHANKPISVIYQAGILRRPEHILRDIALAERLDAQGLPIERMVGSAGGALVALMHGIKRSAQLRPDHYDQTASAALDGLRSLLEARRKQHYQQVNWRALPYGLKNLSALRRWLIERLTRYTGRDGAALRLSELALPVYLVAGDKDGFPVFFGPEDQSLHIDYHNFSLRTEEAPAVEACLAALSILLQYDAVQVNGAHYKSIRPGMPDLTPTLFDMQRADPRPILCNQPDTPLIKAPISTVTTPFHMHRWYERNQSWLADHYLDLIRRIEALRTAADRLVESGRAAGQHELIDASDRWEDPQPLEAAHTRVQYLTSTELFKDIEIAVREQDRFIAMAEEIGGPQLATFDFDRPFDIFYGAGGLSSILIELGFTRLFKDRAAGHASRVRRVSGASAGVLNAFFHAINLAANRHPDLYLPAAQNSLDDLYDLFDGLHANDLFEVNWLKPWRFPRSLGNSDPLRRTLRRLLTKWTGSSDPEALTFEDLKLPLLVSAARASDGVPAFLGMPGDQQTVFGGTVIRPVNGPVIQSVLAGMAVPLYLPAERIGDDIYLDVGAGFFDATLLFCTLAREPASILSIHLGEPPGYSFGYPERTLLSRSLFDTHTYQIPEQRRRSYEAVNRLYEYFGLRRRVARLVEALHWAGQADLLAAHPLPDWDEAWWQTWQVDVVGYTLDGFLSEQNMGVGRLTPEEKIQP